MTGSGDRPARIAILDYGIGNVRSVEKAFEKVGGEVVVTSNHDEAREADGVVVPGVGAFSEGIKRLRDAEFDQLVAERLSSAVPVLGICLGMQFLFESSTEHGNSWGLGLIQGRVDKLDAPGLKVPQMGWNTVRWTRPSPLTTGLPEASYFYFVNSYSARVVDSRDLLGEAVYGAPFTAVVERAPLYGTQFHPEKSSTHGLKLLENFCRISLAATEANHAA